MQKTQPGSAIKKLQFENSAFFTTDNSLAQIVKNEVHNHVIDRACEWMCSFLTAYRHKIEFTAIATIRMLKSKK